MKGFEKRLTAAVLVMALCAGMTGCGLADRVRSQVVGFADDAKTQVDGFIDDAQAKITELIEYLNEEREYVDPEDVLIEDTYAALFAALDSRDADAVLALFAENVRKEDKDIEVEVQRLLERWPGNTELWYYDGISGGAYSTDYGVKTAEVTAVIPAFAGDEVFWVLIDVVYRDDRDEKNEGVSRMLFYTAEDYCRLKEDSDDKYPSDAGLHVAAEEPDDPHVVCIDQYPVRMADAVPLDPAEVEEFVQTNQTNSDFIERFGPPHGTNGSGVMSAYYWLPEENGEPRYLELGVSDWEDRIWGVYVKTTLDSVDTLWVYRDQQEETAPTDATQ